jgi:hypothetical protein
MTYLLNPSLKSQLLFIVSLRCELGKGDMLIQPYKARMEDCQMLLASPTLFALMMSLCDAATNAHA